MSGEDMIQSCLEHREARCRKETCEENEIDPRSYCHNICAKPEHVCGQTTCEKFISHYEDGGKKLVCIPRRKCTIIRHFGPPETEPKKSRRGKRKTKNKGEPGSFERRGDSGSRKKGGKYGGTSAKKEEQGYSDYDDDDEDESDEDEEDDELTPEQKQRQSKEVQEMLNTLTETLDAEGMAAIYALAGSDICPCCNCKICQCKLRNVDSKTLLDARKQALIRRKLREEDELRLRSDLTEDERRRLMEEKLKKGGEYEYSFDYFYEPDLEAFEKERRERQEMERQKEIERENAEEQRKEEELKRKREEEAAAEAAAEAEAEASAGLAEAAAFDEGIQAEPDTQEQESQFYGKEQKKDLIDEYSEVPVVTDKVEEWDEITKDGPAWTEYKAAEWAGMRHQDVPSVIESQTSDAMAKVALQFPAGRVSVSSRITSHRPSISTQSSIQPQIDLQMHAFDKSWLDEAEKHSLLPIPPSKEKPLKEKSSPSEIISTAKPQKPAESYSTGPILRPPTSEVKPEMIPLVNLRTKKPPTAAETMEAMESLKSEKSRTSVKSAEAGEKREVTRVDEYADFGSKKKGTYLTDVCRCLPGFCTCGKQHYTFKKETESESEDFGMGFRPLQVDKMVPSTTAEREKVKQTLEQKEEDVSEMSSCSCFHSDDELQITPCVSRIEVVDVSPTLYFQPKAERTRSFVSCTRPKYQKTLVIVKPEAVRYQDVILRAIKRAGLDVLDKRLIQLTPEQVAEIYTENFGSAYFPMFVQQLSSSPILVIAIAGSDAIQRWNAAVGPDKKIPASWFYPPSMRRRFGVNVDILDVMKISEDFGRAKAEIRYFFPLHIIDPILISSTMVQDYCDEFIHPTLLKGLFKLVQYKPADPVCFLAEWLLINNPFHPMYKQTNVSLAPT